MTSFLNKWARKLHRWLAIPFIVVLLFLLLTRGTDIGEIAQRIQAPFMIILALTGAYLWLLPYLSRWQRNKRKGTGTAKV